MVKFIVALALVGSVTAASAQTRTLLKPPPNASLIRVQGNMSCGFAPFPPLGCKVGPCVCDQNRQNCHYEFICN